MTTPKLERRTFSTDAYQAIRETLLDGERFVAGQKISIESLARELGVSRSPVWAAVAKLEAEGLLQVVPRQGVFIVGFDPGRVAAIFEAREGMEGMAARLAAGRATGQQIDAMAATLDRQVAALKDGNSGEYRVANLDFHYLLLEAAKSPTIESTLRSFYAQTEAMCLGRISEGGLEVLQARVQEHRRVFEAIAKRDEETAEAEAKRHVRNLAESTLKGTS